MSLHPAWRLFIPAAILVVMAGTPRRPFAGTGSSVEPLLSPTEEPPPDVPLAELFHELSVRDSAGAAPALTVVEFSDFGCPFCGTFENGTFPALRKEFVESGRVRWRFVPFVLGVFPNGAEAMRAATCVAEQDGDAFWRMHDTLFRNQSTWKGVRDPDALFRRYAEAAGAEGGSFGACYDDARSADRVTAANALAARAGVRSTPTFFVGQRMVQGALPVAEFRKVIQTALPD